MAYNNFRPDFNDLHVIGFVETTSGKEHPFDTFNECRLNDKITLCCDAFWDFYIRMDDVDDVPIQFQSLEEIECFIDYMKF